MNSFDIALANLVEQAIKEAAVDCRLNKNANIVNDDDEIVCM